MLDIFKVAVGPVQTNCYIVSDGKNAVVIDPGDHGASIYKLIVSKGLLVDKILLTHGHFDHINGVNELKSLSGAKVYISTQDVEMLNDSKKNFSDIFGVDVSDVSYDITVNDGDKIPFADKEIKVIATPGHSKGSVCYVIDDLLFSGDTLFNGSVGRTDGYGGNYQILLESVKKLSNLKGNYRVLSGHGTETTLEYERKTNPYMGNEDYDTYF